MKSLLYILIVSAIAGGCDLFSTRNPEEPGEGKSSYRPPTSPDIVVQNFQYAVLEKNTRDYTANFFDAQGSEEAGGFLFFPAADGIARYQSIFQNWGANSERSYFDAFTAQLPDDIYPDLRLSNSRFEVIQPDSAVYITDYYLFLNLVDENSEKEYSGAMSFTIIPDKSGNWSIHKWYDIKKENDTAQSTWSILKGQYSN